MSRMRFLAHDEGPVWITPEQDAEASEIGRYWNALRHYRRTGDDSRLWPFEGEQIAGHIWETDLDAIDFWAATGQLDFEDLYEDTQDQEEE